MLNILKRLFSTIFRIFRKNEPPDNASTNNTEDQEPAKSKQKSDTKRKHQPESRVIRVFISSTFNDMFEERDVLVKHIFPELRRICEERHVTWGEVDLRWGIPDEATAEGKVLGICLEEIRRCRPYFIGVLGERYGWIPETLSDELIENEQWLSSYAGRSVTELEILHGVLDNPEMENHAYFYFRDPEYITSKPAEEQSDFRDANKDAESRNRKLTSLKDRIRESPFPVHDNYPDPETFGQLVLEDFKRLIDRLYPEEDVPDAFTREASEHEAFARSRKRLYLGGEKYFPVLDAAVEDNGPPLVVTGESGSGKSALLANWVAQYQDRHPDAFVIQHYIGATGASADWAAMVRRIIEACNRQFGVDTKDIPEKPEELRMFFANFLYQTAAKGRVVLMIDALNQLDDHDQALDLPWLPPKMPENIRLIVSTLPGRSLEEIRRREWRSLKVKPLEDAERKKFIREYLKIYSRALNDDRVNRIADAEQARNPLYLKVLLEELRLFGKHEELDTQINYYLEAQTIPDLFEKVLIRWEHDYEGDTDLVGDAMSLLWAARRGLSEAELQELLGVDDEPLPRAIWSPLYLAASDSLVSKSGLLSFFHDYLRDAVRDAYIPTTEHQQKVHLQIANYFRDRERNARKVDEYPWQLCEAKEWQRLYDVLADLEFFDAVWTVSQWEVKRYWATIEASSSLRMVKAYENWEGTFQSHSSIWWNISTLLRETGNLDAAFDLLQAFAEHFQAAGDTANMAASFGNQSLILMDQSDYDEAMKLLKDQERIYRELGDKEGFASCFCHQAAILMNRSDYDEAMKLLKVVEQLSRELGDKTGLAVSFGNQAVILQNRGNLDAAMKLHKEEERIYRELGHKAGLAASFGNQSVILRNRGDLDGAMKLQNENERICRELGDKPRLKISFGNQALILINWGEYDRAMKLLKEEERICWELGDKVGLSRTFGNQSLILKAWGELDEAMKLLKQQEKLCREIGNIKDLQLSYGNQAVILKNRGDLDGALKLLKEQEKVCREIGNKVGLQLSYGNQALILVAKGDYNRAMKLLKANERICRELGDKVGVATSFGNQALVLEALGDIDGTMKLLKEQERICVELGEPEGLARSKINQATLFVEQSRFIDALPLAEEAFKIAQEHGLAALLKQIEPIYYGIKSKL